MWKFWKPKPEQILKPHEKLQRFWLSPRNHMKTAPANEAAVAELEAKFGVSLPIDFRDYLLNACPIDDDNMDDNLNTWWTLERIKSIQNEHPHPIADDITAANTSTYLIFADHCIWCWAWAVSCGTGPDRGRVIVIGNGGPVAQSFSDFVDIFVKDPMRLS